MKFYLIFVILTFIYCCSTKAVALIDLKEEKNYLLKGKLKFIRKGIKKGVYMVVNIESSTLESVWMYIENEKNFLYKEDPIKINFNKQGKAIYGLLSTNWCIKCNDLVKKILEKKVIFLDHNKNFIGAFNIIEVK